MDEILEMMEQLTQFICNPLYGDVSLWGIRKWEQ